MKRSDFDLLRKFMAMTLSPNDAEALAALRMANRTMASAGTTWDRFFDRAVRVDIEDDPERPARTPAAAPASERSEPPEIEDDPARPPGAGTADDATLRRRQINAAFELLREAELGDRFRGFVVSLKDQWDRTGRLSANQITPLLQAAEREREKAR